MPANTTRKHQDSLNLKIDRRHTLDAFLSRRSILWMCEVFWLWNGGTPNIACILIKLTGPSLAVTGGKIDVHRIDAVEPRRGSGTKTRRGNLGKKCWTLSFGGAKFSFECGKSTHGSEWYRWSAGDSLCKSWTSTMAIPMSSVISECQADQLMDPVIQSQSSFMINIKVTQAAIHLINLMTMLCPFSVVAFLDIFGTRWRLQALHVAAIEAIPAAWENMFGIGPRLSLSIGIVGGGTTYTVPLYCIS